MKCLTLICCLFVTGLMAQDQDRAVHIVLGMPLGILGDGGTGLNPKPGFALGLEYWSIDEKGNAWSASAVWNSFKRVDETKKETFEYLTLRGMPLVWQLGKAKKWYAETGAFVNYLLHRELKEGGAVTNDTKKTQRTYAGLCGGLGIRLGEEGKSHLLVGLRDDFGLKAFGAGTALKFNTITLFAGLEL